MFNKKTINLRKATIQDKIKIARLHYMAWKLTIANFVDNTLFDKIMHSFFIDKWKYWLKEKNKVTLLAEQNNLLLGFITFEIKTRYSPEIQFVYITHKYRLSNLQKILCEAVFKKVAELGFSKIYFSIAKKNRSDLVLYKLMKGYAGEVERVNQIFGFEFYEICYEFDINLL
jgi:hypothetical protein